MTLRVFAEKFQLRGDGETFAFLILARHPCVQDGWSHAVLCRRALTEHACRSPCADSICVSTGVPGLLFRSHASSKRNIVRNASNWSTLRGFPPVVPWAGDTSSASSGDGGIVSVCEVGLRRGITWKAEGAA